MKPTVLMVPKIPAALVTRLRESYEVLGPMDHSTPDALPAGAAEAEALLTMGSLRTDAALIDALPRLRLICCYGTGVEGVDGGHAKARGIALGNAGEANAASVAEFAMGLLLATARQIPQADRFVRAGRWKGNSVERMPAVPGLADLPFVGPALFQHHPLVYGALALAVGLTWFLYRTRPGLILRAVGESPESAHALGYPVRRIRLAALLFGGACCGLAGAFMSLVYTPMWVENMVAGRGWIALALTPFATWRPLRVLVGAYLFGGITILTFHMQALGVPIASQLLSMLPYLATILVLVLISRNVNWIRINMPASLGRVFNPNH